MKFYTNFIIFPRGISKTPYLPPFFAFFLGGAFPPSLPLPLLLPLLLPLALPLRLRFLRSTLLSESESESARK